MSATVRNRINENVCDKKDLVVCSPFLNACHPVYLLQIDFEETAEILRRGILAFNNLRKKWAKMVEFFQMVSNLIENSLTESVNSFLQYSERAKTKR